MITPLTAAQVHQAVEQFWKAFSSSSPQQMAELYAPDATLFGVEGTRTEPGRLALARRQREYFDRHARITARPERIDVRLLNDTTALASCSFHFDATNVGLASGKVQERHINHGRATHVFQLDEAGKLLIVHEHLSSSDIRKD